jgi:hypothetical protein
LARACAALFVLLAVASGCAATDERTRTDDVCAKLETWISNDPSVLSADVTFLYTPVNPGDASARIELQPGTDKATLTAAMVRKIWESELDPLRRITVSVHSIDEPALAPTEVSYELPRQSAELEKLYGKRPELANAQQVSSAIMLGLAVALVGAVVLVVVLVVLIVVYVRRRRRAIAT